jgi:hypothetical protein
MSYVFHALEWSHYSDLIGRAGELGLWTLGDFDDDRKLDAMDFHMEEIKRLLSQDTKIVRVENCERYDTEFMTMYLFDVEYASKGIFANSNHYYYVKRTMMVVREDESAAHLRLVVQPGIRYFGENSIL